MSAALERLHRIVAAVVADGPLAEQERVALLRLGRGLGLGPAEVDAALERPAALAPPADPAERTAVLRALREALGPTVDAAGEALLRRVAPHLGATQVEVDALLPAPSPPLAAASPHEAGAPAVSLQPVLVAGRALLELHARGVVHGDVRPETVNQGPLLAPAEPPDPGAALRARLRTGADPEEVAWVAPEVARGGAPTPAADVYGLAAVAYQLVRGLAPLGQIDLRALSEATRAQPLGPALAQALSANPTRRPELPALLAALEAAAPALSPVSRPVEARQAAPEAAPATSLEPVLERELEPGVVAFPARVPGKAAEGKQVSAILVLVLGLGGVFVLVGAIGLAVYLGGPGLFLLLALLTGSAFGGGLLAEAHDQPRGGLALLGIGTQLLWADAAFLLNLGGLLDEPWPWALASTLVGTASVALAARRGSLALWVLTGLGGMVAAACLWAAIGPGGRAFVLAVAAGGLLYAGERTVQGKHQAAGLGLLHLGCLMLLGLAAQILDAARSLDEPSAWTLAAGGAAAITALVALRVRHPGLWAIAAIDGLIAGLCLWITLSMTQRGILAGAAAVGLVLAGEVLIARGPAGRAQGLVVTGIGALAAWGSAAHLLEGAGVFARPGPWAAAGAVITALTWALALRHRAALLALLGALDLGITALMLGEHLSPRSVHGAAIYTGLVAVAFALVAAGAHRAGGPGLGLPAAVGAGLWAWGSAGCGLGVLDRDLYGAFGTAWPLLITALAVAAAHRGPGGPYRLVAAVAAFPLVAAVPTVIAFFQHESVGHLQLAIGAGLAVIAAAFWGQREPGRQVLAILPALAPVTLAPAVLCLVHCWGEDGAALLLEALESRGLVHETRFAWLASVVGSAGVLVGLSFLLAPRAASRVPYRLLEASGLLLYFGVLTILSLARLEDWFYPGLIAGGGAAVVGLGVWQRRAVLVGSAGLALLANLWIQYFIKLRDQVPTFGLLLGFGLGLVVFGLIYERRVKQALPALRSWG